MYSIRPATFLSRLRGECPLSNSHDPSFGHCGMRASGSVLDCRAGSRLRTLIQPALVASHLWTDDAYPLHSNSADLSEVYDVRPCLGRIRCRLQPVCRPRNFQLVVGFAARRVGMRSDRRDRHCDGDARRGHSSLQVVAASLAQPGSSTQAHDSRCKRGVA